MCVSFLIWIHTQELAVFVSVNMDHSSVLPITESDSGSSYKAASFTSCISHRFRIPIALFHPVHPCPEGDGPATCRERPALCAKSHFYYLTDTLRKYALTLFPQPPEVWIRSQRETRDSGCTENMKSWIITRLRTYFFRHKRYQVHLNRLNSKHTSSTLSPWETISTSGPQL